MSIPERLAGQVIIVTGGTRGIGRAIAERLVSEAARVVITGRDEAAGEEAVAAAMRVAPVESGGSCRFARADNSDPEEIRKVVADTLAEHGLISGLVNNAASMRRETILTTSHEFMQEMLNVNLVGAVEYCRLVLRHMIDRGEGSIVNIGSTHAWAGMADLFPYSISKGGLLTLTHHIARNYGTRGIRCNWVTVGWVVTPGEIDVWKHNGKNRQWIEEKGREVVPLGRLQTPAEIGSAVAFFLSDEASQITDTELHVTGGLRF